MNAIPASDIYYRATARPHSVSAPLAGRHEARVIVIGGGMAGVNLALGLAERGVHDVVLLERETLGHGASGRNGGFVFGGYSLGEQALLDRLGPERARALHARTRAAVSLVRARVAQYAIDCDAVAAGVIWANWFRDPEVLRVRQRLLAEHYGVDWEWLPRERLREMIVSERYHDALFERDALHLHPLDYLHGLARAATKHGVRIHEHSPAWRLRREGAAWRVDAGAGEVRAQAVVLACGGYLARLRRDVDRAVLPIATYVMVTEPLGVRMQEILRTRAAVYDTRFAFDYYRALPDTRLLWGGRISVFDRSPRAVQKLLLRDLLRVFPRLRGVQIDYAWSGLMSYARHQMPQLGTHGDGLWWTKAFGGHCMAPATAAGDARAAAIAEGADGWRAFSDFGLSRSFRPFGYLAAQANYWWLQGRDRLRETLEG